MAARKTLAHSEEVRLRIKASQLINALQDRALGLNEMDAVAVRAALGLVAKVVPDMKAVEHRAPEGASLHYSLMIPPKDG